MDIPAIGIAILLVSSVLSFVVGRWFSRRWRDKRQRRDKAEREAQESRQVRRARQRDNRR